MSVVWVWLKSRNSNICYICVRRQNSFIIFWLRALISLNISRSYCWDCWRFEILTLRVHFSTVHWLLIINRILDLTHSSSYHWLGVSRVVISAWHRKPTILSTISLILRNFLEVITSIKCRYNSISPRTVSEPIFMI